MSDAHASRFQSPLKSFIEILQLSIFHLETMHFDTKVSTTYLADLNLVACTMFSVDLGV